MTTTSGIDILSGFACDLLAEGTITDYNRVADECGELTLLRLDFADGTYAVAGAEYGEDGETIEGYTWTTWTPTEIEGIDDPLSTDGDTNLARFVKDMRVLAAT